MAKQDNIVRVFGHLPKMPLGDRSFTVSHAAEEDRDGHDELKIPHRDVHLSAANFVFGHNIHENRQAVDHSTPLNTRAVSIGGGMAGSVKQLKLGTVFIVGDVA